MRKFKILYSANRTYVEFNNKLYFVTKQHSFIEVDKAMGKDVNTIEDDRFLASSPEKAYQLYQSLIRKKIS